MTPESFDTLFDRLAIEAQRFAKFLAEKPKQEGRIPHIVKRKVAKLWEKGICYPEDRKQACFRIADSKKGGPYQWFSYSASNQTIYPNLEYFVQIAAFHDLMFEYGYPAIWLAFEHNESVKPVSISIDIGIKFPDGRKAFLKVKERKEQWEALVSVMKSIGIKGVDLIASDRRNDPLRKAKYIIAGRPNFFAGYYPEGFDIYMVKYKQDIRFILESNVLPSQFN